MNTEQQLKRIQDKLQQLLKQHAAVQKENAALKQELQIAGKKISDSQQTIDELKQQTSILKVNITMTLNMNLIIQMKK